MDFQIPFFIHQNVLIHSLFLKGGRDVRELSINNFFYTLNNSQEAKLDGKKKLTSDCNGGLSYISTQIYVEILKYSNSDCQTQFFWNS